MYVQYISYNETWSSIQLHLICTISWNKSFQSIWLALIVPVNLAVQWFTTSHKFKCNHGCTFLPWVLLVRSSMNILLINCRSYGLMLDPISHNLSNHINQNSRIMTKYINIQKLKSFKLPTTLLKVSGITFFILQLLECLLAI